MGAKKKTASSDKKSGIVVIAEIIGVGVVGRLSSLLSSSGNLLWSLWSGFIVIAVGLALAANFFCNRRRRWKTKVWASYAIVLLFFFIWFVIWSRQSLNPKSPNPRTESFAIFSRGTKIQMNKPRMWLVWNNGERVASPIHVEMWVQLTNLKGVPLTLNSYQFEGRMGRGDWELMPTLDPSVGRLFFLMNTNADLTHAVRIDYGKDIFHSLMQGKSIAPHETITGAVFLEAPTNGFDGSIRLRIKDAADVEDVQPVRLSETNYLDTTIQWGTRIITGEFEDISQYPKISYR